VTRLQREIERHAEYWRPILGLEGWDIRVLWNEKENTATCAARPQYLTATLHFNLPDVRKECRTVAEREELVLHEMVHSIAWRESERSVSQITLSLLRAREAGRCGR
jgi:hypothetical protein